LASLLGFHAFRAEEGGDPFQFDRPESAYYLSIYAPEGTQLQTIDDTRTVEVIVEFQQWEIWVHPDTYESQIRNFSSDPVPDVPVGLSLSPWSGSLDTMNPYTDAFGKASTVFHNSGNSSPVTVSAEYNGASASLVFEPPVPGTTPPQEEWNYSHSEATITANLSANALSYPLAMGQAVTLDLYVTYDSWDVLTSNLGNSRTENHSSSPAVSAYVSWSIESGDGYVSGNTYTDGGGIAYADFVVGSSTSVVRADVSFVSGNSTSATYQIEGGSSGGGDPGSGPPGTGWTEVRTVS